MTVLTNTQLPITEGLLFAERSRLVKLCLRLTGDQQLAEDLTQETLLIGWQQQDRLRDQSRRVQWLNGIARNLCRGWLRRQKTLHTVEDTYCVADDPHLEAIPDAFDLDQELDQSEFAQVLDRALGHLPSLTSAVLVDRYIHGMPQMEVASRLGISQGAVEARIQRGKLTLRRVLTTDMRETALELGLAISSNDRWQTTRIWCPSCSAKRLEAYFSPVGEKERILQVRCSCGLNSCMRNFDNIFDSIRSFQPARKRARKWRHQFYQQALKDGIVPCPQCSHSVSVYLTATPETPAVFAQTPPVLAKTHGLWMHCHHCQWLNQADLEAIASGFPEAQAFVTQHKRIFTKPACTLETAGTPAVAIGFQAVNSKATLDFVFDRQTLTRLKI